MPASEWRRFRRTGTVRAERLTATLQWTTEGGDVLNGRAGDWRLTDGERTWTVADEQFQRSYAPADDGTYVRTGVVRARPGASGELVETLEGPVRVQPGDWVVQGSSGECWPVPAVRFAQSYAAVDETDER